MLATQFGRDVSVLRGVNTVNALVRQVRVHGRSLGRLGKNCQSLDGTLDRDLAADGFLLLGPEDDPATSLPDLLEQTLTTHGSWLGLLPRLIHGSKRDLFAGCKRGRPLHK
ncbi:MAG TPA: hypothetical protein VNM37_16150 [Candidatus Dormibacteraeota bacterium]|nr:hypothetical protein [Candidatus Dormibacteraeota bacterium]